MRFRLGFIFFCQWISGCSNTICWKGYPSSAELLLRLCQILIGRICVDLFLGSLFCSIGLWVCCSASLSYCLDSCSYIVSLNIGKSDSLHFAFLFKTILVTLGLFSFHISFRISLSMSTNKLAEIFGRNCVSPTDQLSEHWHLHCTQSSSTLMW